MVEIYFLFDLEIGLVVFEKKSFSSPLPKSQLNFSYHNLSVVRRCRCIVFINFSHFPILLQNRRTNFNHIGTKHPWVMRIQVWSNEGPHPFLRGDNYETAKIH